MMYNSLYFASDSSTQGQNQYNRRSQADLQFSDGAWPAGYHDTFSMYMEISTRKQSNFIKWIYYLFKLVEQ